VPCNVADIAKKYFVCVEQALTYLASRIIGRDCSWTLSSTFYLVTQQYKGEADQQQLKTVHNVCGLACILQANKFQQSSPFNYQGT